MNLPPKGKLFSVGDYGSYRRGVDISEERIAPVLNNIQGVIHIACGWYHNLLYTIDNVWWGFGENSRGQLDMRHNSMTRPKQLTFWKDIQPLWFSCSDAFTVVIAQDQKLYACGDSKPSQLTEIGNIPDPVVFCDCGADTIVVLPKGNGLYFFPPKSSKPQFLNPDKYFIDCAACSRSITALDSCGIVWISESNSDMVLSPVSNLSQITSLFSFSTGVFAVSSSHLYYKGSNYNGMGGVDSDSKEFVIVPLPFTEPILKICGSNSQSFIITSNYKVYSAGSSSYGLLMRCGNSSFRQIDPFKDQSITCMGSGLFHAVLYVNGPVTGLSNIKKTADNFKKLHLYE